MNILIFIIFILSISALVIGCLAYTNKHTQSSSVSDPPSQLNWQPLGGGADCCIKSDCVPAYPSPKGPYDPSKIRLDCYNTKEECEKLASCPKCWGLSSNDQGQLICPCVPSDCDSSQPLWLGSAKTEKECIEAAIKKPSEGGAGVKCKTESSPGTPALQGWANLGDALYYGTGGPCVCTQIPFEFDGPPSEEIFSCKNGNALNNPQFPDKGTCYNSKQQCLESECNPNKIGYKKDSFTKGGYCDCTACDLTKDSSCTKQSYDTCVKSICG